MIMLCTVTVDDTANHYTVGYACYTRCLLHWPPAAGQTEFLVPAATPACMMFACGSACVQIMILDPPLYVGNSLTLIMTVH